MSAVAMIAADLLVAVLLVATISSCVALSRRITRLKADEAAFRGTIGDLMLATEAAERAIAGLRTTLGDCDRTLADRLRTAERYAADLAEQVEAGEAVMSRIGQIVESTRHVVGLRERRASDIAEEPAKESAKKEPARNATGEKLSAAMAAAQALADRAVRRLEGEAA